MSNIKWPRGSHHHHFKKQISENIDTILNGTILAIDPASVRLGYAVTKKGKVTDQGVIELDQKAPINQRLQDIVYTLQKDKDYDILAVEMIRGKMAHVYLKFSVGAIIGGARAPVCIEVPIHSWKAYAGKEHKKSDDSDAVAMAETLIALAKEIKDEKRI
jgi:Holliday junction resolvasome RuvABC endonuclease subunit